MQISAVKYPSINAKMAGMYSKKLKKIHIDELTKQNTTTQIIALLKSFNDDFKDLEDTSQRINISILLDKILINDIQKIYRLLNKTDKEIFKEYISIYEIKCIKNILRKLFSNTPLDQDFEGIKIWQDNYFRNLKNIEKITDYSNFLEFIKYHTKYYPIFEQYGSSLENINIFEIENKLDKFYFEKMMKIAKSYNRNIADIIGKQIDLNNIIWIYRMKKNFNFPKEKIKEVLIDVHYKVSKKELEKIIQADNITEITDSLKNTYYAKNIDFEDLANLERNIDKYVYDVCKKYFLFNMFDPTIIYAYIVIIDKENNDIMNVVEAIRYNLDKEDLKRKLIR